jgi:uncharacterized membrane protein YedE/YeeE
VTRRRIAGGLVGIVFGVVLSWSGMTSPVVIRDGLLFHSAYLYEFFASAVAVAAAGQWLVRRAGARAILTGEPVTWTPEAPQRRHVAGSVVFGVGWGIGGACPGPIATQVGQGIAWGAVTMVGVIAGIVLFLRRDARAATPAAAERAKARA